MQFWPFAVGIVGSAAVAVTIIVAMMRLQKPFPKGISPHHRWNERTDLIQAQDAAEASK